MGSVGDWIAAGRRGGVFFVFGDDAFRRTDATHQLVAAHLDDAVRDFNLDVVRGTDVDVETLASLISTPPMMADTRVVHVKDAQGLSASSRMRELVIETAKAPPPGLALLLDADIAGSSARFWKDLAKAAHSFEFATVPMDALPGLLMDRARDTLGVELEPQAATALVSAVGGELGVLVQELDKLAAVTEAGEPITLEVVERAGIHLPAQDRWAWFDLVAEKRWDDALRGLEVLTAQGESEVGLVLWLAQSLLRMAVAREAGARTLEEHLPGNQRWLVRKLSSQAARWSIDELEQGIEGLAWADRTLKSGSAQGVVASWLLARQAADLELHGAAGRR